MTFIAVARYLRPLRLVKAPASVSSLEMELKDKSSQVRLVTVVIMLCLLRVVNSLPKPATDPEGAPPALPTVWPKFSVADQPRNHTVSVLVHV